VVPPRSPQLVPAGFGDSMQLPSTHRISMHGLEGTPQLQVASVGLSVGFAVGSEVNGVGAGSGTGVVSFSPRQRSI